MGLEENIRVRLGGYAYRRPFAKFLTRYALLSKETWPKWKGGDVTKGCEHILKSAQMERGDYQFGKTKLFIKSPDSVRLAKCLFNVMSTFQIFSPYTAISA